MMTSAESVNIPLSAGVEEQVQRRLARRAAGIPLEPGGWLIRDGEEPRFVVIRDTLIDTFDARTDIETLPISLKARSQE